VPSLARRLAAAGVPIAISTAEKSRHRKKSPFQKRSRNESVTGVPAGWRCDAKARGA